MIAVFTLMLITSGGIYGFLSGAYQSTATQSELLDKSLVILQHKQTRFNETKEDLTLEKTQINQSISDLRVSLSNPHSVSWYDKNSETVITSSSGSARRALQAELKTTIVDRDNINLKLEAILDSITTTDIALLNKEISNEDERELGPLKYLAGITGWPMDRVVNWFLLLIIFVFDPLAIALVVAANFAFAQIRKPKETVIDPNPTASLEEDDTTEPSESLKQRVKENQLKLKEIEIDEDYFSDLEGYIKYTREEDIENLTYPQFTDKHYSEDEPQINTYGDDDWATPIKDYGVKEIEDEPIIELEDDEIIEVTVEPTEEDMARLTDTTKTLIVEEIPLEEEELKETEPPIGLREEDTVDEWLYELGEDKGLDSSKENLPLKKILRYTKRK